MNNESILLLEIIIVIGIYKTTGNEFVPVSTHDEHAITRTNIVKASYI